LPCRFHHCRPHFPSLPGVPCELPASSPFFNIAPGILGGSNAKAREQAAEIQQREPSRGVMATGMALRTPGEQAGTPSPPWFRFLFGMVPAGLGPRDTVGA